MLILYWQYPKALRNRWSISSSICVPMSKCQVSTFCNPQNLNLPNINFFGSCEYLTSLYWTKIWQWTPSRRWQVRHIIRSMMSITQSDCLYRIIQASANIHKLIRISLFLESLKKCLLQQYIDWSIARLIRSIFPLIWKKFQEDMS